jgi:hypothetical protein
MRKYKSSSQIVLLSKDAPAPAYDLASPPTDEPLQPISACSAPIHEQTSSSQIVLPPVTSYDLSSKDAPAPVYNSTHDISNPSQTRSSSVIPNGLYHGSLDTLTHRLSSSEVPDLEVQLQKAILAYKNQEFDSVRSAATEFKVSHKTLARRLAGGLSRAQATEITQILLNAEEKTLVR